MLIRAGHRHSKLVMRNPAGVARQPGSLCRSFGAGRQSSLTTTSAVCAVSPRSRNTTAPRAATADAIVKSEGSELDSSWPTPADGSDAARSRRRTLSPPTPARAVRPPPRTRSPPPPPPPRARRPPPPPPCRLFHLHGSCRPPPPRKPLEQRPAGRVPVAFRRRHPDSTPRRRRTHFARLPLDRERPRRRQQRPVRWRLRRCRPRPGRRPPGRAPRRGKQPPRPPRIGPSRSQDWHSPARQPL